MKLTEGVSSMIEKVLITQQMRQTIYASAHRGVLNQNTLVDGEGNHAGRAGEVIVQAYLPKLIPATKNQDMLGVDFIDLDGVTYDVKAKGNSKTIPQPHFDCTVPDYQLEFACDAYIFTRIAHDLTCGYIMGYIPKSKFVAIATLRREGDQYNNAGREARGAHWVVPANKLTSISYMRKQMQ